MSQERQCWVLTKDHRGVPAPSPSPETCLLQGHSTATGIPHGFGEEGACYPRVTPMLSQPLPDLTWTYLFWALHNPLTLSKFALIQAELETPM